MHYRGSQRGEPSIHLPPEAFIAFLQNHDQIGNRALGGRITTLAPPEAIRAAGAIYLLLPQIPMLFMGEEWGARSPFPFFCDFGPELAGKVRQGRRREFAKFPEFQDPAKRKLIPDPQAESTFASAKLWNRGAEEDDWLNWYRRLLDCRKSNLSLLSKIDQGGRFEKLRQGAVVVRWDINPSQGLVLAANLASTECAGFPEPPEPPIWVEGTVDRDRFAPWTVAWWTEKRRNRRHSR
jgi:1,4-alpha-glucan branching enzyme